jgi:anti-sigma B factor antagonist
MDRFGCLDIRSERAGNDHVVALVGELDLTQADRVSDELLRVEASDARRIVLDLSGLDFIDSTGVRLMIAADLRARANGNRLTLLRATMPVQRVFELTGLLDRLPFTD